MRVLLDTHVLAWMVGETARLSQTAREILENRDNELFVSAISGYEISNKFHSGGWPEIGSLALNFVGECSVAEVGIVPLSGSVAALAGSLSRLHRDPFDRLIAATAIDLDIPLLSKDTGLDVLTILRIWA